MMMQRPRGPVLVLKQNTKREQGRKAQMANIQASKAIADIVRTTLGPSSMLKMLLDPMGGIVLTNDGNSILREVDVEHPAAKSLIELSRSQDEEVGDGSTSVVVLAGELLHCSIDLLDKYKLHPSLISAAYINILDKILDISNSLSIDLDTKDNSEYILKTIEASLGTKFASRWKGLVSDIALRAIQTVTVVAPSGRKEIDIKRYCKVEKIPGGDIEESQVLDGILLNKDVTHPKMARKILNPRVLLLDCPLEYKKGESMTSVEVTKEDEWARLLAQEELEIKYMCDDLIRAKPSIIITEKGVSDLAQHFLYKAGISVIRRVRKMDNNRLARATGATVVSRTEEIIEEDIGTLCAQFEIKKLGDEYFSFFTGCEKGTACTIMLRGGSKDVLNEIERNLVDAMNVARNITMEAKLLAGGGATEMAIAARLNEASKNVDPVARHAYMAVAQALEVIPRTLAQNCGANVVKVLTELRARHNNFDDNLTKFMGVNGVTGDVQNMEELNVLDCFVVKQQMYKAAVEAAAVMLRIDDVLCGVRKAGGANDGGRAGQPNDEQETFGDARDG